MVWINKDDLEEFVSGILSYPVRVENSKVGALSSNLFFSDISVGSGLLLFLDTKMNWLTVDNTLVDCSLSSSSSDSNSVDNVSLLLLESEGSGFIESRWSGDSVDNWKLSILPASYSKDKSDNIRLLPSPKLLQIFVCTHFFMFRYIKSPC